MLETAERLDAAGLRVSFDVPMKVGGVDKKPDLTVADDESGATFCAEVSILFRSDEDQKAHRRFRRITDLLMFPTYPPLAYAGRLLRVMSDEWLDEVVPAIEAVRAAAAAERALQHVAVPRVIELAFAPVGQMGALAAWCRPRGLEPGLFEAPTPEVDQLRRFQMKVAREAEQLPAGKTNLVVIHAQDLFLRIEDPTDLLPILEDVVLDYRKIGMLVVTGVKAGPVEPQRIAVGDHLFVRSTRGDLAHDFLVVRNPYSAVPMAPSVLRKLELAFSP